MRTESVWLVAPDSKKIHMLLCSPEAPPTGAILMVHGMGEHTGRYLPVAKYFCDRGYLFTIHDQRGHGQTPGPRGVSEYDALVSDIDLVLSWIGDGYPGLPIALYGHSLGGNLVLRRILCNRLPGAVRCAIAGSPWLRLHTAPSRALLFIAKVLSSFLPAFAARSPLRIEDLTRSEEVRARTRADSVYHFSVGARLYSGVAAAGESIIAGAAEVPIALLVIQGMADLVVSPEATLEFIRRCGSRCESRIWPYLYHELHNEPEGEEVLACVASFLERKMGANP